MLADLFCRFAAHDVHHVSSPKGHAAGLLNAVDGAEQLTRSIRTIPHLGRVQAVVAVPATVAGPITQLLAKICQQSHPATVCGFGQAQQGVELATQALLELFACRTFVNHAALVHHILQAIGHPCIGGQAVTPGTAGFLVVALNVLGHIQMGDKAHIGLVDAHAEGDGGHHHHALFAQKPVLVVLAHPAVQPGVVGQRTDTGVHQSLCHIFHPLARLAIDDARIALVLAFDEAQKLLHRLALFHDGVADVRSVETADEGTRILQLQALQDVGLRQVVGRGGEGHARHTGKAFVQNGQGPVFRAEVVTPLAHAMRLVNGKQAQQAALEQRVQQRQKPRVGDPLRCRVQQSDVAAQHALLDLVGLFAAQGGVQEGSTHARFVQGAHLVVHQRNQGGHDDADAQPRALASNSRYLVTQRLAAARGHQHQRVAAVSHVFDDGLLWPAKLRVAKHFFQDGVAGLAGNG